MAQPDTLAAALAPIGVAGLRLGPDMVVLLGRLGLKTIGALAAVPRLPLARRFAKEPVSTNPLVRLDQAMGRLDEPIAPLVADPPPRIVRRLTELRSDVFHGRQPRQGHLRAEQGARGLIDLVLGVEENIADPPRLLQADREAG